MVERCLQDGEADLDPARRHRQRGSECRGIDVNTIAVEVVLDEEHGIHREIGALSKDYDWVVIDGPPRVSTVAKSAIAASDMVLIPVQPIPSSRYAFLRKTLKLYLR